MKMNSLDALVDLVRRVGVADDDLAPFHPRVYAEPIAGKTAAELGGEPILHMRAFSRTGHLPAALIDDVKTRRARRDAAVRIPG